MASAAAALGQSCSNQVCDRTSKGVLRPKLVQRLGFGHQVRRTRVRQCATVTASADTCVSESNPLRRRQPWAGRSVINGRASSGRGLRYTLAFLAFVGAGWLTSRWLAPGWASGASTTAAAGPAATAPALSTTPAPAITQIAVVADLARDSGFGVSWGEVLSHTAQRLTWADSSFRMRVHDAAEVEGSADAMARLAGDLVGSQITVLVGVHDNAVVAALSDLLKNEPTVVALGSSPELDGLTRMGGRPLHAHPTSLEALLRLLPGNAAAKEDAQVHATVQELFDRKSSDDFLYVFLVLINQYVREVPAVANSTKTKKAGMPELKCMIQNCGGQIFRCYADTSCRTALNCLNECQFNDQVCSYRCIASYESPLLADFSLCVLQKHNCLGLSADIPMIPDPAPMRFFNGQPMTHELAEDLFIGWLQDPSSNLPRDAPEQQLFSWRVFGGKNPAYDYFPCQYQLFYRGKAKNSMWYDPVFKVKTLDDQLVWRRRHYRVRRAATPGTFHLSVLDNGVTSNEFWRILDCAEDLEWCAFYYSGAAAAAGTSYSGAILASKTGRWPDEAQRPRMEAALERAGIKMWEVSSVDNSACQDAPLDPSLMAMP